MTIELYCNGNLDTWLIDSGATISAIKYEYIKKHNIKMHFSDLQICGIGGNIKAIGYTYLRLQLGNDVITQKVYVFNSLPCITTGILGHDFLYKNKAILNYETDTISIALNNRKLITLKLKNKSCYTLTPRSESIVYVRCNITKDCVVCAKELNEGVFIASTITKPIDGKIPILILNTTNKEIKLDKINTTVHDLDDYNYCKFEKPNEINADRVKTLFTQLNFNHLNTEEKKELNKICAKYADVFQLPNDKLTVTTLCKQSIQLKPNIDPVYTKNYRLPQTQKKELDKQIDKMLKDGIIEPTRSEWSSPVLLVPKKVDPSGEKKWRLVIDYRKLNDRIQDDKFPLPNITEILDSLSGSIYFSHLDLFSGYYQQELEKESRKFTAFCSGQYQMTRLPMGLKISPGAFSRMITLAMSGLTYEKCFVYLDDIVVFGRNLENHNSNLISVLERLRKVNLKLNPVKCEFLKKELLYLGHVVTAEGILPDPGKIEAIRNYPTPNNEKEVKSFVALANYYRKFIPKFAEKAYPLTQLSKKNIKFHWDKNCQNAFCSLKKAISSPPVLQYPNFSENNEFILQTDASGYAIGAVLSNNDDRPIAFASRSLNKSELNYATIEKELLAIVWAIKYFRPYLYGRHFKIKTDHKPLIYLFNMKDPSSRLTKFRLLLEEYDFTVEYIKGKENIVADALSRTKITVKDLKEMNECINVMTRAMRNRMAKQSSQNMNQENNCRTDHPKVVDINSKINGCVELRFLNVTELRKIKALMRSKNYDIQELGNFTYVENQNTLYIKPLSSEQKVRDTLVKELGIACEKWKINQITVIKDNNNKMIVEKLANEIKNDVNWTSPQLCILKNVSRVENKDDKKVILNDFHLLPTSGHAGIKRMYNNIKRRYFWIGLEDDINNFVKKCSKCQKEKFSLYTKEPMTITTTASTAFQKIFLDVVGPLDTDTKNFSYILTLQCDLTKYIEAYPLVTKGSKEIAETLVSNFILRYGIPEMITTDRGSEFTSTIFQEVCDLLQIKKNTSTAYHHQSIGALENTHKSLGAYLRIQTDNNPEHWSKWLPFWCFAYNTSVHTETKFTPFELVFGKKCNLPSNLTSQIEPLYNHENYPMELRYRLQISQRDARENLIKSKIVRKEKYDKYIKPTVYKPNDDILIRNENRNKFTSIFSGPYKVVRDLSPNVEIIKNGKIDVVHKNRTKRYIPDTNCTS